MLRKILYCTRMISFTVCLMGINIYLFPIYAADQLVKLENAHWEVFTNRSVIQTAILAQDGETLLVGTQGGLEQRRVETGQLLRLFITFDGLPGNNIRALLGDEQGGVWIACFSGTEGKGLAYLNKSFQIKTWNVEMSPLPNNAISTLVSDGNGGVWIGSKGGLAHFNYLNNQWHQVPVELADKDIRWILPDEHGGWWFGTYGNGLMHLSSASEMTIFNTDNNLFPNNWIFALASDTQGGLWAAIADGLVHWQNQEKNQIFTPTNSKLPTEQIKTLFSDGAGGVFAGSPQGLTHIAIDYQITTYDTSTVDGLPSSVINSFASDNKGNLWVGSDTGLAHYTSATGKWINFNGKLANLPGNQIFSILSDKKGGVWLGTDEGLVHLQDHKQSWEFVDPNTETPLPHQHVKALNYDKQGQLLWVGTADGLARLNLTDKSLTIVPENPTMSPGHYDINGGMATDKRGGLWIGTASGLVYRDQSGNWELINPPSSLPSDLRIEALVSDGNNGVLGVANHGVAYVVPSTTSGKYDWKIFNANNSPLPENTSVNAILLDQEHQEVWIGITGDSSGLVRFNLQTGTWHSHNLEAEANLPNKVYALAKDQKGGLWVGTARGLGYFSPQQTWSVFNTDNSVLPHDHIHSLESDGQGGLWVGTDNGLAHLSFSQIEDICQRQGEAVCQDKQIRTRKKAAIIIHAFKSDSGKNQLRIVENMATKVINTLYQRGYNLDELYVLSYKPDLDFNQDGQADLNLVDAPISGEAFQQGTASRYITQADIQQAFAWAKQQGSLSEPLPVIFVGHGADQQLLLGQESFAATTFQTLLDDYQTTTNNKVIVVLEACHSGTLVPLLEDTDRLIISSTDHQLAYADPSFSFITSLFDQLAKGENWSIAWEKTYQVLKNATFPYNQQIPQLSQLAKTIAENFCLNSCWVDLDGSEVKTLLVSPLQSVLPPLAQPDAPPPPPHSPFKPGESVLMTFSYCQPEWGRIIYSIEQLQYDREGNLLWPSIEITGEIRHHCEWIGQFTPPTPGKYRVSATVFDHAGLPMPEAILPVEISINYVRPYLAMEKPGIPKRLSIPALGLPDGSFLRLEFYQRNETSLFELITPIEPPVERPDIFETVMYDPENFKVYLPNLQRENGEIVPAELIMQPDGYFSLENR
jgi:ligand-binding sensor domain-containing protein